MTLAEFASVCQTTVCAKSAFNGKILCWAFNPQKHVDLGKREVVSAWSEFKVENTGFSSFARSTIMVFVDGTLECEKAFAEAKEKLNRRKDHA